jgi:hypothetical protein
MDAEDDIFCPPNVIWNGEDGWVIETYREVYRGPVTHIPDHPTFIRYADVRQAIENTTEKDS